jgi:putative nucleotidyltransferase with HDIG domain
MMSLFGRDAGMKKSILFVDDNPSILDGLRRVLRNQREAWDMSFIGSGAEALRLMETKAIDIIISDINMPEMDGIQLLTNVQNSHPSTIRMILSGQAQEGTILKAVAVTHQFLAKPCDAEHLIAVISQAGESELLLQNETLKGFISKLGALPSVPAVFCKISKELQASEPSIHRIAELISQDPSMAAKVLQLVNSAFFARRRAISNIAEAVAFLGIKRVADLVLAVEAFNQFKSSDVGIFSIEELWEHSNFSAMSARKIAEEQHASSQIVDESFTAGLLHDIGQLVLASRFPQEYSDIIRTARNRGVPLWIIERETYAATHAEVGAYLLSIWGLPSSIVNAVAYHHSPSATKNQTFSALSAVHAASSIEKLAKAESSE